MAESKNIFIKSKMNKDLDDRLLQQGEYRNAVNIQVSKSESEDVGALENILGNIKRISNLGDQAIVGYLVSEQRSALYLFLTNNKISNNEFGKYEPGRNSLILEYIWNGTTFNEPGSVLASGSFLNFWEGAPITVNLLEDFLFFTDNRNQPRKININSGKQSSTYYKTEDDVSVAKYTPYVAPLLYQESTLSTGNYETTMKDVVSPFLPDGTTANPYEVNPYQGDPDYLKDKFVRFGYRFQYDDNEYSVFSPFTQECFIPQQDGYFLEGDEQQTISSTVVSFLENKVNQITLRIPMPSVSDPSLPTTTLQNVVDQFKIKKVEILYKESNEIRVLVVDTLLIADITGQYDPVNPSNVLEYVYSCTKPFKTLPEAQTVRVYDKVPIKAKTQEIISNRIVYGNFQTKHTPPSNLNYNVGVVEKQSFSLGSYSVDATTSIVEYPNHSLKQNRNYQAGFVFADRFGRATSTVLSNSGSISSTSASKLSTVYSPYNDNTVDTIAWPGDSLIVQVNTEISTARVDEEFYPGVYNGNPASDDYNPLGLYSWKVVVKQQEQDYYTVYVPSAMKGQPYYDTQSNPPIPLVEENASFVTLINDNINKIPRDLTEVGPQDKSFRSSVILYGRVENSNGRVFSNIGNSQYYPGRRSFTTNVIEDLFDLYDTGQFTAGGPDIIPVTDPNNPYYAFFKSESNPFIAEFITSVTPSEQFGENNEEYANNAVYEVFENLAVLETDPVESRLDIYWETSTSGTIEDLNTLVANTSGTTIFAIENFNFEFNEDFNVYSGNASTPESNGRCIINNNEPFYFSDVSNITINDIALVNFEASNSNGVVASQSGESTSTGIFQCVRLPKNTTYTDYNGITVGPFLYDSLFIVSKDFTYWNTADNNSGLQTYTFSITVEDTSGAPGINVTKVKSNNQLGNIDTSIISESPSSPVVVEYGYLQSPVGLMVITGSNGSNFDSSVQTYNQAGLQWSIDSVTQGGSSTPGVFQITPYTTTPPGIYGSITETNYGTAAGSYNINVRATGPDGTFDTATYEIIIGEAVADGSFERGTTTFTGGLAGSNSGVYIPNQPGWGAGHVISFHNSQTNFASDNAFTGALQPSPTAVGWNNGGVALSCNSTSTGGTPPNKYCDNISVSGPSGGYGLSTGTGYIKLTFELPGYVGSLSDLYDITRTSTIEYRADSSSSWQAAKDIEGNNLSLNTSIGGTINPIFSDNRFYEALTTGGTSANIEFGALTLSNPFNNQTKGRVQIRATSGADLNTLVVTAWAVVGNSPIYNLGTGYGEYRLISGNLQGGAQFPNGGGAVYCSGANASVYTAVEYELEVGDFYYGFGNNRAFSYKINTTAYGSHSQAQSQSVNSISTQVYAREPLPRYVTQFYTDAALTQKLNLGTSGPGYFAYRPSNVSSAGSSLVANAPSNTSKEMAQAAEMSAGDSTASLVTTQDKRIWSGNFLRQGTSGSQKFAQSSKPKEA